MWPNFYCCAQRTGRPEDRARNQEPPVSDTVRTQNIRPLNGMICASKTVTIVILKITGHPNKGNNDEKLWNIVSINKVWQTWSEEMLLKRSTNRLAQQDCHRPSIWEKYSIIVNKAVQWIEGKNSIYLLCVEVQTLSMSRCKLDIEKEILKVKL